MSLTLDRRNQVRAERAPGGRGRTGLSVVVCLPSCVIVKVIFFLARLPQSLCLVFLLTLKHDLLTPMLVASAFFIVALLSCLFVAPFLSIFCVHVSSLLFP